LTLRRTYPTPELAELLRRALAPDETANLRSRVEGSTLILELTANTAASARSTAEDLLPCVATAEASLGLLKAGTRADPESSG
jgi:hypothetical protein